MSDVKKIIEERNNLVIEMAFVIEETKVRELMKEIRSLENKIKTITKGAYSEFYF
tara:strand:+ start:11140 stop:11304 length:165 start_codon:yes stop_codon:yes gene_type:complete